MKTVTLRQFPIYIEKDEDDVYAVECPVFHGCYAQGKTRDEALTNIKEVIELCIDEVENHADLNI